MSVCRVRCQKLRYNKINCFFVTIDIVEAAIVRCINDRKNQTTNFQMSLMSVEK